MELKSMWDYELSLEFVQLNQTWFLPCIIGQFWELQWIFSCFITVLHRSKTDHFKLHSQKLNKENCRCMCRITTRVISLFKCNIRAIITSAHVVVKHTYYTKWSSHPNQSETITMQWRLLWCCCFCCIRKHSKGAKQNCTLIIIAIIITISA